MVARRTVLVTILCAGAGLRAGVPAGWTAGGKTGAGPRQANDVAVFWPPGRAPVLVAAYYESAGPRIAEGQGDAVLAEVGRVVSGVAGARG